MMNNRKWICFLLVAVAALGTSSAFSATYSYVNWTSSTGPTANAGTVSGTLPGGITVTYSGELQFAQTGTTASPWGGYLPATTWQSAAVSNAPPNAQIIGIDGMTGFTNTVTFSSPVTNLIMDLVSLGQPGVGTNYLFNTPFTILNIGPSNQYGGGTNTLTESGNTLTGHEGDGIIEFAGTISSISWTANTPEFWNGFTFGVAGAGPTTPEPASFGLAALALSAIALFTIRKRVRR